MGVQKYHGLLDTGASNSLVAERLVEQGQTQMGEVFGVKVGNGAVQLTSGETEGVVHVGEEDIPFSFAIFDTDAFDVILGNDFFEANPHIKYLSLLKKVPTRTGPRCTPSACNPCRFAPDQRLHCSKSKVPNPKI